MDDELIDAVLGTIKAVNDSLSDRLAAVERLEVVHGKDGAAGRDGKDGQDGRDADLTRVLALEAALAAVRAELVALQAQQHDALEAAVTKAVAALPAPKDGVDGRTLTADDVASVIAAEVTKAVTALPPATAPVGVVDVLIDRDGHLVATLSNGEIRKVGPVVGRDGVQGQKGEPGDRGRDGTIDQLKAVFDGERTLTLCFKDGTPLEGGVLRFAVPLYRDVFVEGLTYEVADLVTCGGSLWYAKKAGAVKPGESAEAAEYWVLCAKRGRDGKQGIPGVQGEKGIDGRHGRDLTQMDPTGRKW